MAGDGTMMTLNTWVFVTFFLTCFVVLFISDLVGMMRTNRKGRFK